MQEYALTRLSSAGGCAAKIEPGVLQHILDRLNIAAPDESLHMSQREDVGITSIPAGLTQLVQSVDTITPVSDDPHTFGAIAAAHALSDLYAKGAAPLAGLLMLSLPSLLVPAEIASAILQGAIDKLHEAGASFLGGHTIASQELQLGLAVTGMLSRPLISKAASQPSDLLVLTKPLGTGIVITALKSQHAGFAIDDFTSESVASATSQMLTLNAQAAQALREVPVHACTDVSGFGLLGHLNEMLMPAGLSACIHLRSVPLIPGVARLAELDILSAGGERNAAFLWSNCSFARTISYAQKMLLFDPQTSGGLLISVAPDQVDLLMKELQRRQVEASIIGQVSQRDARTIEVVE
ncbi:MAG TPA: selenide, water dikinase SelD [Ktedonobacteraceae bacterium]